MAVQTLTGADIKVYIGGTHYKECQSVSINVDYGEESTYGVDSPFPQEIATTRIITGGSITGIRLKASAGLQGAGARPRILESLYAPYTSIKVVDRSTGFVLFYIPNAKVSSETISIMTKGVVRVSFNFKGIVPLNELDVYNP